MKKLLLPLLLVGALIASVLPAQSQSTRVFSTCGSASWPTTGPAILGNPIQILPDGRLCISGTISASLGGFTPNGNYTTLTATAASSASTTLPGGTDVAFQNTSSVDVSCVLTAGASTATTNKIIVRAGATVFLSVGTATTAACINQTGSASNLIALMGGSGLGTNFGGASAGGGGGGAATIADGADVTQGANADAAVAAGAAGTVSAKLRRATTDLAAAMTSVASIDTNQGAIADAAVAAGATGSTSAKLRRLTTDLSAVLTQLQGVTAGGDAVANTATGNLDYSRQYFYNGTTWDRVRGTISGGILVQVSNTLASVGNDVDNVTATASTAGSPVISYNYVFDGTNWDRQRPSTAVLSPCETTAQSYANGVITSATTTRIITPSASNKTYICMFFTKASAVDNVGVYEGTGGTCGTGKAGVLGGTTTANGLVFGTAGDGLLMQAGGKTSVMQTVGTNVDFCLETSTAGPLVWAVKYVQAP